MEDQRHKDRIHDFMSFGQPVPRQNREKFMVSLRKKKRAEIFNEKRKMLWQQK